MISIKKFSFLMGAIILSSSLFAKKPKKHTAPKQQSIVQSAPQKPTSISYAEKSKNFAKDYLTLGFAKQCALKVGIPMLLYQNSYTHLAVYPYLWNQSGPRAAIETLAVNGIIEFASVAINTAESVIDSTDTYGYKAAQCATILAADFLLRQAVTNRIFTHFFTSK